jgi:hypothetical protein
MHLQMLIDISLTKPNCYLYLTEVEKMARPKRFAVEVQEAVSILAVPEEEVLILVMLVLACWIIEVTHHRHFHSLDRIHLES